MHFIYSLKSSENINILLLCAVTYASWVCEEGKKVIFTLNTLILFELFINIFICKQSRTEHTQCLGLQSEFKVQVLIPSLIEISDV